jgi:competence protein ComGC
MQVKRARGFAVVELLLACLVLSILVAVIIMAISNADDNGAAKACRTEARAFAVAAKAYHKGHENKAWPDDHADTSVQRTADALALSGQRVSLQYLDGAQRVPSNGNHGWSYDFQYHTTNSLGCGS